MTSVTSKNIASLHKMSVDAKSCLGDYSQERLPDWINGDPNFAFSTCEILIKPNDGSKPLLVQGRLHTDTVSLRTKSQHHLDRDPSGKTRRGTLYAGYFCDLNLAIRDYELCTDIDGLLKKIKQYEALGSVKEIHEAFDLATKMLKEYMELGTPEEIKRKLQFKEEEKIVFENYRIEEVELNELDEVALEVAMTELLEEHPGVKVKEKKDKLYLIKGGKSVCLEPESFKKTVLKMVKGKTMKQISKLGILYDMITRLGILNKVVLVKQDSDLEDIFS